MYLQEHLSLEAFAMSQAKFINQIAFTYFLGAYTICRVMNRTETSLNIPMNELPMVVIQPQHGMAQGVDLGCSVFLVDEDAVFPFLDDYISMHDEALFRNPEKYVLVMVQATDKHQPDILKDIQSHPAVEEIANLLLVLPKDNTFELLTHRYVGNRPDSLELLLLDKYLPKTESFVNGNDFFPDKMGNLMGKTLKVATFYFPPWIIMRQTDDGVARYLNQSYTIDGLDGHLLIQFCLRYNCTWDLHDEQKHQFGQIFENSSGNGVIGAMLDRKVDFAIGALGGYHHLFKYFSFTRPIQRVACVGIAPKPKLVPRWILIYKIFDKSVWTILGGTFIAVSFSLYILQASNSSTQQKDFSWVVLNVLKTFLLTSGNLTKKRVSEVMLATTLLMFTIVVGNVYIGQIHSILTVPPYQAPIDTVQDLAESGIRLYAPLRAWMFSLDGSENPRDQMILANFHVPPKEEIPKIADSGREATVMALLENGHLVFDSSINARNVKHYRMMSEQFFFEFESGYATKTWPLLDKFDNWVMWLRDASLFQYVELIEVNRYVDHRIQVSIEQSRDRPQSQLKIMSVDEISGALIVLGLGYAIALVVFLLEIGLSNLIRIILQKSRSHQALHN